ncbi:MAG: diacylglycerol kinase family protein, partial [Clostridia bacterium]|nr:diacylglycerol kinase family protein [Clostridia bacterium]
MNFKVLFNPLSGNVAAQPVQTELKALLPDDDLEFNDVTKIPSMHEYLAALDENATLLLVGGDGTLNRFINDAAELLGKHSVYYYAAGNGNDFWSDIGKKRGDAPVCIDGYLKDLPTVTVKGNTYKFLNGIGFGIDGYCCETGDKLRSRNKPVNYTAIAVKGLLFHFKPCTAKVTVDGKEHIFKKVWIAPTMNGRYYGGGMIPTPAQDRLNGERTVSACVMYGKGKLRTLIAFPTIFKGEHVNKKNMVAVFSGKEITVKFYRPCALQIDGETVLNVTEYT